MAIVTEHSCPCLPSDELLLNRFSAGGPRWTNYFSAIGKPPIAWRFDF